MSLKARCVEWLRSSAATGYGMSFLIHLFLMLGMALWILPQIREASNLTTVVDSEDESPQAFDAMDDVHLESPAGSDNVVIPQITDVIQEDADLDVLEHQFLQDVTASDTQGDGGSSGVGDGGFRLLEPRNAVKAGSFTAWTIPIFDPVRFPDRPKAGDSPRRGQDYHIVVQVKVPGNRETYDVNDLSGKIIGSDGYTQPIPGHAFVQNEDGRLVPAKPGRRLAIVDGVAQLVILVPGAEALVKDTIRVKSRLLRESQTLKLIFRQ